LASLLLIPRSVQLFTEIERDPPDVVHLFWGHYPSLVGYLVSRHLPTCVLSMSLGAYDLCMNYGCSRPVARRADVVRSLAVANNRAIQSLGVADDRIIVVYSSVDFSRLDAAASISKTSRRIVSAGRLIRAKAMHDVLDVFAQVALRFPDASLAILGDGPELQRLEQQARGLGIEKSVEFLGHVSHETVFQELAKADVFLFMSCHAAERLPNVVKEAMASGCFTITTDTVGIEELLHSGKHGYVVPQHDVAAAALRLHGVFADFDAHRDMIRAAREHVRSAFDIDANMAALVERWEKLVDKKRAARAGHSPAICEPLASVENQNR
jgi:glycosyltransferase involved in cell wall biosynthesis